MGVQRVTNTHNEKKIDKFQEKIMYKSMGTKKFIHLDCRPSRDSSTHSVGYEEKDL